MLSELKHIAEKVAIEVDFLPELVGALKERSKSSEVEILTKNITINIF